MYWNPADKKGIKRPLGLTLTWDVLKSAPDIAGLPATWININMRCIEILHPFPSLLPTWLTLTWDVLKLT